MRKFQVTNTGLLSTFCRQTQWDAPSWDVFADDDDDDDDDDVDDMDLGTPTNHEMRVSISLSYCCCVHPVPCDVSQLIEVCLEFDSSQGNSEGIDQKSVNCHRRKSCHRKLFTA